MQAGVLQPMRRNIDLRNRQRPNPAPFQIFAEKTAMYVLHATANRWFQIHGAEQSSRGPLDHVIKGSQIAEEHGFLSEIFF